MDARKLAVNLAVGLACLAVFVVIIIDLVVVESFWAILAVGLSWTAAWDIVGFDFVSLVVINVGVIAVSVPTIVLFDRRRNRA